MSLSQGGIYLHIPFCRQACVYCDFHFITSLQQKARMVAAIQQEAAQRADFFAPGQELGTLYFGGGTPSVLTEAELGALLETIQQHFSLAHDAEITLEANPDDLTPEYLRALRKLGINRLSIGTQSFRSADLQWMNRSHTAEQALRCVHDATEAGFTNISIDLIFGLPGSDPKIWEAQLQQAVALPVQHLSLYALTIEEKTALAYQVKQGQVRIPDDPLYGQQFLFAHQSLEAAGFEHYELSNYALPGFRSRHNSAYWIGVPYLGLGPSAHSYDGKLRAWNLANNARYLQQLHLQASPIAEQEVLSQQDRYHEYIMTHLRKKEGINAQQIEAAFVPDWRQRFGPYLAELIAQNKMVAQAGNYALSPEGWLVSDGIIGNLFMD